MSFSFDFVNDDIDIENRDEIVEPLQDKSQDDTRPQVPIRSYNLLISNFVSNNPADCLVLLTSLPSNISYDLVEILRNYSTTSSGSHACDYKIAKRSMFDIKTQLMAEADCAQNENDQLLSAIDHSDLASGTYEGGFKTWEGAIDLAKLLLQADLSPKTYNWHIIELGAGSAVPSMVALTQALRSTAGQKYCLTICDYNEEVLKLATLPNVLLATTMANADTSLSVQGHDESSLEVDDTMISKCRTVWERKGIEIKLVSGPWGKTLADTIHDESASPKHDQLLILASETIYELSSLVAFTELVLTLLKRSDKHSKAWIAAKRVYFGVGGGVVEFCAQVIARGGNVVEIVDIKDQGVARVILEVTIPTDLS